MTRNKRPSGFAVLVTICAIVAVSYGTYMLGRWINWKLSYEGKVRDIVIEMVRKEALR